MKRRAPTSFRAPDSDFVAVRISDGSGGDAEIEVARFPVTVARYREFIAAKGYADDRWWSERGRSWRDFNGISQPTYWDHPRYAADDLPVTGISFWEAEAYARFREAELPTETEWYLFSSNGQSSRFPWGDEGDEPSRERANLAFFGEFGDSERVPVNTSLRSQSRAGVRDLIGNVAEWCLPHGDRELRTDQLTGVLRGGAAWHVPGVADSSFRDEVALTVRDNQTGIRLIRRRGKLPAKDPGTIGWPSKLHRLGRSIRRPTEPFRQEGIPTINEDTWRLKVHGIAVKPRQFTLKDIKNRTPTRSRRGLFVCVCRWAELNVFQGAPLEAILEECGLDAYAIKRQESHERPLYLLIKSVPGPEGKVYETYVPLAEAIAHNALLAYAMDEAPLTAELGAPLRYVDLHYYGYKNVKCVSELVITDERHRGWWEKKCHYDVDGTILPGTVTIVGKDAVRFDIEKRGIVAIRELEGDTE